VNDDYLWDRSGEPDPEVARLEKLLGRYGSTWSAAARRRLPWRRKGGGKPPHSIWVAAAVIVVILVIAATAFVVRFRWRSGAPWEIVSVEGTPTINGELVSPNDRLGIGQTLVTDSRSRVRVRVARVGTLEIGPGSEVELIATGRHSHRIAMRRGVIDARVWAPPFTFGVNTPAGLASDVGCAFDLRYSSTAGQLRVTSGWVDFDGDLRSSLVPAGAVSDLRQDLGPGTPYWDDAPAPLREALREFDATNSAESLQRVLAAARPRDAMSLLHILDRADRDRRGSIFDRAAQLAPPPAGVTRERVVAADEHAMDAWRQSLGLGGAKKWWLHWRDALPEPRGR